MGEGNRRGRGDTKMGAAGDYSVANFPPTFPPLPYTVCTVYQRPRARIGTAEPRRCCRRRNSSSSDSIRLLLASTGL